MNYYSKIGIEVGGITESLNDKTDRDMRNVDTVAGADAVIEYQVPTEGNNYTWYRKYKSGWVEQGGQCSISKDTTTIVTMPIEMSNTRYSVMITPAAAIQTAGDGNFTVTRDSTTQFGWCNGDDFSGTGLWEVRGMAAN